MISRVFIADDDHCDSCGKHDRSGVSFGAEKPVICEECLKLADEAMKIHIAREEHRS